MKRVAVVVVVLAVLVGVASAGTTSLNGVYQTKLSGQNPSALNGTWLLSIAQSRAFAIAKNGTTVIGGKVKIKGSKVTFQDVVGPYACGKSEAIGVYGYSLAGKKLKLTRFSDHCVGRIAVLTTHTLTKVR